VKIRYEDWVPGADAAGVITQAEEICRTYASQGYDLTLRQLYYQFVARALIPNTQQSYKRLGSIVNKARMAGLLDWSYIVDRTRNLVGNSHWQSPSQIMAGAAGSYAIDKWSDQPTRVEVWVEKDALSGVVGRVAEQEDVSWFACRGYVSQSELWAAGRRLARYMQNQNVVVLHLGDHDPSGIDMSRDIADRLHTFIGHRAQSQLEVRRIALNRDQVDRYDPPPNPAKLTDSRIGGYLSEHGDQSWELDALEPAVLAALITDHIGQTRDADLYATALDVEEEHRRLLQAASDRWDEVAELVGES
jgi:hypothetical protein